MQKTKSIFTVCLLLLITGLIYFQSWFGPVKNWHQIKTLELYSVTANGNLVADIQSYLAAKNAASQEKSTPIDSPLTTDYVNVSEIELSSFAPSSYSAFYQNIVNLLGQLSDNAQLAINWFDLLGYFAVALVSFYAFLNLKLSTPMAFAMTVLFNFTFYHQMQSASPLMSWYATVPLYFLMVNKLFDLVKKQESNGQLKLTLSFKEASLFMLMALVFPWLGVAYSTIGTCLILATGFVVLFVLPHKQKTLAVLLLVYALIAFVSTSWALEYNQQLLGVSRFPTLAEVEQNSFKINSLLLPNPFHRIAQWSSITDQYILFFPLNHSNLSSLLPVNADNASVSLGLLGTGGFLIVLVNGIFILFRKLDPAYQIKENLFSTTLQRAFFLLVVLVLLAGFGGVGSLLTFISFDFAIEWYRASPFISFLVLLVLALALQQMLGFISKRHYSKLIVVTSLLLMGFGLFDQVPSHCGNCRYTKEKQAIEHHTFFKQEAFVNSKAADWLQLPRTSLDIKSQVSNQFIYTDNKMKSALGSEASSYTEMLSPATKRLMDLLPQLEVEEQILIAQYLGFKGIVVNKNNWCDWQTVRTDLANHSMPHLFEGASVKPIMETKGLSAFAFKTPLDPEQQAKIEQLLKAHAFVLNKQGLSNTFDIQTAIDFSQKQLPSFVKRTHGFIGEYKKIQGYGVNQNQCVTTTKSLLKPTPEPRINLNEMYVNPLALNPLKIELYTELPAVFKVHLNVQAIAANRRGKVQEKYIDLGVRVGAQVQKTKLNFEATELVFEFTKDHRTMGHQIELLSHLPYVTKANFNNNLDNVIVINSIQIEIIKP